MFGKKDSEPLIRHSCRGLIRFGFLLSFNGGWPLLVTRFSVFYRQAYFSFFIDQFTFLFSLPFVSTLFIYLAWRLSFFGGHLWLNFQFVGTIWLTSFFVSAWARPLLCLLNWLSLGHRGVISPERGLLGYKVGEISLSWAAHLLCHRTQSTGTWCYCFLSLNF